MTTFQFSPEFHINRALDFANTFNTDIYYLFVGDFIPSVATTVNPANNTVNALYYDVFNKMIMGKKLTSNNILLGIRNVPYEADLVYSQYDDQTDLSEQNYYVVVNAISYSHIFKCLHNNNQQPSTVEPNFAHIEGANTILYQTSDGYQWKYMYSVDNSTLYNFATNNYIPVIANTTVTSSAVDGEINVIQVEEGGKLYNNYVSGIFQTSDIRVETNVYQISNSNLRDIQINNGFYTGCIILLTQGTGQGQYEIIIDSYSNSSGNYILLTDDFTISPANGTKYEITPQCLVSDNGKTSDKCIARALVNSNASNSISHVEILYPGTGHFIATAQIIANSAVNVLNANKAVVRPILSPEGGHGANIFAELQASHILLSTTLANSESNTILTTNQFKQVGIIKNPIFANVELVLSGAAALFTFAETAFVVNPIIAASNVSVNTLSNTIIGNVMTATFKQQFGNGDTICLSNGSYYQIANIVTVTDNNHITIASVGAFDSVDASAYMPNISETLVVTQVTDINHIYVSNTFGGIGVNSEIIGQSSGTHATVTETVRNGTPKNFSTFIQLYKYNINPIYGTFSAGEMIKQGNTAAYIHSINNSSIFVSAPNAQFIVNGPNILGTNGATATLTAEYIPELEIGSGTIQYIDNIEPVTRGNTTTQTFKLILDF